MRQGLGYKFEGPTASSADFLSFMEGQNAGTIAVALAMERVARIGRVRAFEDESPHRPSVPQTCGLRRAVECLERYGETDAFQFHGVVACQAQLGPLTVRLPRQKVGADLCCGQHEDLTHARNGLVERDIGPGDPQGDYQSAGAPRHGSTHDDGGRGHCARDAVDQLPPVGAVRGIPVEKIRNRHQVRQLVCSGAHRFSLMLSCAAMSQILNRGPLRPSSGKSMAVDQLYQRGRLVDGLRHQPNFQHIATLVAADARHPAANQISVGGPDPSLLPAAVLHAVHWGQLAEPQKPIRLTRAASSRRAAALARSRRFNSRRTLCHLKASSTASCLARLDGALMAPNRLVEPPVLARITTYRKARGCMVVATPGPSLPSRVSQ